MLGKCSRHLGGFFIDFVNRITKLTNELLILTLKLWRGLCGKFD